MTIVDFHAHAFPDRIAERAMAALCAETDDVTACLDGRVDSLVASMDRAGIDRCVLGSIATKPEQFAPILEWSRAIASQRVVPFASLHPDDPDGAARVRAIAEAGLCGIKLHPYYQRFSIDEPRMWPVYEAAAEAGLIILMHSGFDVAFPHVRIADPVKTGAMLERFPGIRWVAAHLGAWKDWDEVERHLVGRDVHLDLAYTLHVIDPEQARRIIEAHGADRVLFATDSPWYEQDRAIAELRGLGLDEEAERKILGDNAQALLDG